ncbi:MAG: LPS assembly lipoprotein LptE [Bacteroidota bacterium]
MLSPAIPHWGLFLISVLLMATGCYRFSTGPTLSAKTTLQVDFEDTTTLVDDLSSKLSDALILKFEDAHHLQHSSYKKLDFQYRGAIVKFQLSSLSSPVDKTKQYQQLELSVVVHCRFKQNQKVDQWTNQFTRYNQFDTSADFTIIQDSLVAQLNQQIAEDIFNRTFQD